MRSAGGRGHAGLTLAVAILLIPTLIPPAESQAPTDPWWGPSDRTDPTAGWAIRIPVTIENRRDHALVDPFVGVEVDFSALLVKAGWTNQTRGADARLRGFTLDVDSIRVIEYARGFVTGPILGAETKPTPHIFYPALLEGPRGREFNAEANPAGTIMFQISGTLAPQAKRDFYVYANPLEYGKTPAPVFDAIERSSLDALMWGTRGNVYYGYEAKQENQDHGLTILATSSGRTTVTVSTLKLGRFTPLASTGAFTNPFTLQEGQSKFVFVGNNEAWKIEGDKPITVLGKGGGPVELYGFVPGRSGSFADDAFDVANFGKALRVIKASPGRVTVTVATNFGGSSITLDNARPLDRIQLPAGSSWAQVTGTGKFLLSMNGAPQQAGVDPIPFIPHPVPAITGGPSGTDFFSYLHNDEAYFRLCPEANATIRAVDYDEGGTLQIYPEGVLPATPPARVDRKDMCTEVRVPSSIDASDQYEFYSTKEERDPLPGSPVPFRLSVGTKTRVPEPSVNLTRPMIGNYAGLGGVDYYVEAPAAIFGHYNYTRLTIFEERLRDGIPYVTNRTQGIERDGFSPLTASADGTGRFHVLATKPIAIESLAPTEYQTTPATESNQPAVTINNAIGYVRYIPGRPVMPSIQLGIAEFRGPLVDIRSPETPDRQLPRTTGPGSPLSVRLDVYNLGRWVAREQLTDTITLSCSTPTGWTVEGCNKEMTLSGGSAERLDVIVTPSVEDVNLSRTILVEAKSKAGGVSATFKLNIYVEVRYGVGMWFDVEGGRKTIDPPIGLEPGTSYRYNIVLKNTGSTQDTFRVRAEDPREGWTQSLLLENAPVTSVQLDGGASVILHFLVQAPPLEQAPQNIVTITAESDRSALAADVVNTATRIRPKVDLALTLDPQTRLAEPHETVVFNITTQNKGNDVFTVLFRQDSILPKGWNATLSVPEITLNPNPTNDPALSYVLQLRVTPPEGARAGDLASVKIAADVDTGGAGGRVAGDELSAVVVIRRIFVLATPPVFDAEARPGETLRFVLPVTNQGNGQVSVEILPGATEARLGEVNGTAMPGWDVQLGSDAPTLGLNETLDLPLQIRVPPGAAPGLYNLTFTTRLSREAIQNLSIPVRVEALSRVAFVGSTDIGLTPGRPVSIAYSARNTGNVESTFELTATAPEGWNVTLSPARAKLAPGASVPVLARFNATRDATDGQYDIDLVASAPGSAPSTTAIRADVRRPDLAIASVDANSAPRAGELVLVTAGILNRGGIEAENVSVALVADGRIVDRVLIARIPVGTTSIATLSWVATERASNVRVVLDPDQEIALTSRTDSDSVVKFGSRLPVPGLTVPLLAALAVSLALATRARRGGPGARP